jgi:hypothetical protein
MPSSDSGDDFVWVSGPGEGFWIIVSIRDEAVDRGLEIDDRSEDTALEATARQLGEALDSVEPGCRGWREVTSAMWPAGS